MFGGDDRDGFHLTGYTGVVHDEDGARVRGDHLRHLLFVDIQRVRPYIDENRCRAAQRNSVCRR